MNKRFLKKEIGTISSNKLTNRLNTNEIGTVPAKTSISHPITLDWIDNKTDNPICLTKYNFHNNNITYKYNCKTTEDNINDFMYTPPIGISTSELLSIYNIKTIDNLKTLIDNNIEDNITKLNRILNAWIRVNYETLRSYNDFLEKVYLKLLLKLFKDNINNFDPNKLKLDKEVKEYIDYWIANNNPNQFKLNLLNDIKNNIERKYNKL